MFTTNLPMQMLDEERLPQVQYYDPLAPTGDERNPPPKLPGQEDDEEEQKKRKMEQERAGFFALRSADPVQSPPAPPTVETFNNWWGGQSGSSGQQSQGQPPTMQTFDSMWNDRGNQPSQGLQTYVPNTGAYSAQSLPVERATQNRPEPTSDQRAPALPVAVTGPSTTSQVDQMNEGPVIRATRPSVDLSVQRNRAPVQAPPVRDNTPQPLQTIVPTDNSWFSQGAGPGLAGQPGMSSTQGPQTQVGPAASVTTPGTDTSTWTGPSEPSLPWKKEGYSFEEVANGGAEEGRTGYAWYPGAGNKARPKGYMTQALVNEDGSLGPEAPVVSGYYFWNGRYYPLGGVGNPNSGVRSSGWNNQWGGYSGPSSNYSSRRTPGTWATEGVSWRI